MVNKTITELPLATFIQDEDTFHISQASIDKRVNFQLLKEEVEADTQAILTQIQTLADEVEMNYEDFLSRYYGAAESDPAVDPNGNPPTVGDLYYNSLTNKLKVYNGTSWVNSGTDPELTMSVTTPVVNGAVQAASAYGFWGLGSKAYPITSVDLNTELNTGFYNCTSCPNSPDGENFGALINIRGLTGLTQQRQVFFTQSTDKVYYRRSTGAWDEVAIVSDLGTAAAANVQTSSTDTTDGALMAVGAFGIGGNGITTANLNTIEVGGIYAFSGSTTNAPNTNAGMVIHTSRGAQGVFNPSDFQLALMADGKMFTRRHTSSWQPWVEMVTADGNVKDYADTDRRVGWVPGNESRSSSKTATDADVGNIIQFTGGTTATLTLPALSTPSGSLIQVVNRNTGNLTIAQSGITLRWLQGGSSSTGNRTVATQSVVTLCKLDGANWAIWGNGIS